MASANPPSTPGATRWSRRFTDLDEMAETIAAWDDCYEQLSPGAFAAGVSITASPSLEILTQSWNLGLSNHGVAPRNRRAFAFPVASGQAFRFNGIATDGDAVLTARRGSAYHLLTVSHLRLVVASFDAALCDAHLRQRFHCTEQDFGDICLLPARSRAAVLATGQALDTIGRAMVGAGPAALARLERHALDTVFAALTLPPVAPDTTPRERLAGRIEAVLRDRLADPPGIGELCRIVGAPERTVHLAFRDCYGISPAAYLRRLRLNAARRALLLPGEAQVTATATRFGFFHFGRFAAEYRALFGETPSATLRRGIEGS